MAYKWGNLDLNVIPERYQTQHAESGLAEIPILPDGTTNPASIIQQAGRTRKKVSFDGFVQIYANYTSLLADYLAGTVRAYTGSEGTMDAVISELSPATKIIEGKWDYSITFMEA